MAQLKLKGVYKRYDNAERSFFRKAAQNDFAVKNLSFACEDGEFVGILGPSGCGKTTTLRMVAGLEEITAGDIYIGETRINDLLPKDRNIGLAFEDYALYPPLTVYENLAFNMRAQKKSDAEVKKAIDYVAPLLKVEDLLGMKPPALSGGQKQRVNIARAIVRRPGLLLLDEPLSHLDGKMRQQLRHEIKRMHHEIKCTTIIVTHDQMEAMSLADRIVIMKDGDLQQMGAPIEVYDNPVNAFVAGFIGEPPMNLLSSVIVRGDGGWLFTFPDSDLRVEVPQRYHDVVSDGMRVTLGVRPVDVMVANIRQRAARLLSRSTKIWETRGESA
ncbi:MAG: ABC transporter ATP-binding protein [Synergistaceae bacterium]|jgi:multiple sugar transport system ATP-binding protein|nr:ABC transporter ATP-binding protein [Synergistaceae bacterium]